MRAPQVRARIAQRLINGGQHLMSKREAYEFVRDPRKCKIEWCEDIPFLVRGCRGRGGAGLRGSVER